MKDPHKYHQFERTVMSDEWYTPQYILQNLGKFDLDPCSAVEPLFKIATTAYTKVDNGLTKPWNGRVFLNPPYSQPLLKQFLLRMCEHRNGIALVYSRFGNQMFQHKIFPSADSIFCLEGRVRFLLPSGDEAGSPGADSCLVSFSEYDTEVLKNCGLKGVLLKVVR